MTRNLLLLIVLGLVLTSGKSTHAESAETQVAAPLPHAHAHNDYHHTRPLTDALEHGFCSVEADVFLIDGQLLVGHELSELRPERTLQALYLDPLKKRVQARRGWVYEKGQPLTLLVDFKSSGEPTYEALRKILEDYREILSGVKNGEYQLRAVEIVISGNRPIEKVAAATDRYVFLDGRIKELNAQTSPHLVPLVSDNWNNHFSWRGQGVMSREEKEKLRVLVQKLHSQQRRLRFWATPDKPAVWTELADAGVDLIGTDDLAALQKFWTHRAPATK